jgi:hypothetical protein
LLVKSKSRLFGNHVSSNSLNKNRLKASTVF